nr:hypothetical protein [uncultured Campylobacter sp.]
MRDDFIRRTPMHAYDRIYNSADKSTRKPASLKAHNSSNATAGAISARASLFKVSLFKSQPL